MKAPLIAAIAVLGLSGVPAFADCGKAHPQALAAPVGAVLAQASDSNSAPKADEGNQEQNDDDDN